jgi:hypothetical protein
MTESS